jgi:hypothetical protein
MKTVGFCTHFTQVDEWAFTYALRLVRSRGWQLNICHWLNSPYKIRRDIVPDDLFQPQELKPASPALLTRLELQLREYYECALGDFTNVAFKLCEGQYQVELVRCMRQNLLDIVVMGYQSPGAELSPGELPLEEFAAHLKHPLILVGRDGPESYLLNDSATEWLGELELPEESWSVLGVAETVG